MKAELKDLGEHRISRLCPWSCNKKAKAKWGGGQWFRVITWLHMCHPHTHRHKSSSSPPPSSSSPSPPPPLPSFSSSSSDMIFSLKKRQKNLNLRFTENSVFSVFLYYYYYLSCLIYSSTFGVIPLAPDAANAPPFCSSPENRGCKLTVLVPGSGSGLAPGGSS